MANAGEIGLSPAFLDARGQTHILDFTAQGKCTDCEPGGRGPRKVHFIMSILQERVKRLPQALVVGPVVVDCPRCNAPLGAQVRITLETARRAAKRPAPTEVLLVCPGCQRLFVAALALSPSGRMAAVTEVAA